MKALKVFIVDDDPDFAEGVAGDWESHPGNPS